MRHVLHEALVTVSRMHIYHADTIVTVLFHVSGMAQHPQ